jgi:heat shock protein HslJ
MVSTVRKGAGMSRRPIVLILGCALLCFGLLTAGCGEEAPAMDPTELEGVEWTLTESSVSSSLGSFGITAVFDGTKVAGFSGVNQYGGPYTAGDDGSLKIGDLASTMMAGPEPAMKAEQEYMQLLAACASYEVDADTLTLLTAEDQTLLYVKAKETALPGTSWDVTSYNNGKGGVTTPVAGSELTIAFDADGQVSGAGGVNRYSGPYEVDGSAVTIGPLATTKMAGDPELMAQEQAFIKALESSTTWSGVGGKLELRDADGSAMASAKQGQ